LSASSIDVISALADTPFDDVEGHKTVVKWKRLITVNALLVDGATEFQNAPRS